MSTPEHNTKGETGSTVLVIDDEPDIRRLVALSLSRINVDTHLAANLEEARRLLQTYRFDACLCDMRLPDGDGVEFVSELQRDYPDLPTAVITAHGHVQSAVEAMRNGAFDFVSKPVDLSVLRRLVNQALVLGAPTRHSASLTPENPHQDSTEHHTQHTGSGRALVNGDMLVGDSPIMNSLRERIHKVSRTNAPVWITGESGTGKELVARLIHTNSARSNKAIIAINCGAIPNELVESELFGHLKGSFTGAHQDKEGLFRAADGGTLFLDEVAELPLHMQVKVLRAIQERAIRPVGSHEEVSVDVRLLSASHSDLSERVNDGSFRQDLYYRLNVISIRSPALRDRREDIPTLALTILQRASLASGADSVTLDDSAMQRLCSYDFPGNVRELENVLARASAMADSGIINADGLELNADTCPVMDNPDATDALPSQVEPEEQTEAKRVLDALNETRWNRRKAAELLGLTYRQLRYRIQQLGLDQNDRAA